jgi:hypothetical protein
MQRAKQTTVLININDRTPRILDAIHTAEIRSDRYIVYDCYTFPSALYLIESDSNLCEYLEDKNAYAYIMSILYKNPAVCFLIHSISDTIVENMHSNFGGIQYYDMIKQELSKAKGTGFYLIFNYEHHKEKHNLHNKLESESKMIGNLNNIFSYNIKTLPDWSHRYMDHPYIFYNKNIARVIMKSKPGLISNKILNNPGAIRFIEKNMSIAHNSTHSRVSNRSLFY